MASGWNLWVWLECIGVVIIIITFLYSTCISSFFGSSIPISLFIFKMFFVLVYVIFMKYIAKLLKEHSRSLKNRDPRIILQLIISIIKNVERMSTVCTRESRDVHVRGTGDVL